MRLRVKRLCAALMRRGLRRYVRAAPDAWRRDVTIVLMSAWGMGGTIRAAHNLAGHLADKGYGVELLSVSACGTSRSSGPSRAASPQMRSMTAATGRPRSRRGSCAAFPAF